MAKHKAIINLHARNYIAAVFESRLRDEGFVCPDDKLLCWYRIHGENIVNSIVFFSPWSNLPLMLSVGYGIHPLFLEPIFSSNVHFTKRPVDDDRFVVQPIVEDTEINSMNYSMYSPEIAVDAPGHPGKGIYTLDGIILPHMKKIQSVKDAYAFHKERRLAHPMAHLREVGNPLGPISKCFIDMALYQRDEEVYPFCEKEAQQSAKWYRDFIDEHPNNQEAVTRLKEWEQLVEVFKSGKTDEYLSILHRKEQTNVNLMRKRLSVEML